MTRLETERLVLRLPRLEDVDDLLEFVGDDEVMQWIGGEAGDRAAAVESVERSIGRWELNRVGPFAVLLDGHVIGRVGLLVWDTRTWETSSYEEAGEHAQTELGWALTRRHWGHGYATEAARAVRDWAYAECDVERLISLIAPDNVRSIRVAEKLGARPEQTIETPHGPADVWVHPR
ncbi:MAG: GNAT family N-acetyltransferase [Gaiellaceae bacterium]|jgi:RimJ/RimL family protein N-acetyltransferase